MRSCTVTRLLNLASVLLTGTLVSPSGSFGQERDSGRELSSTLAKLEWRNIGPAFTSGRIADIVAVETDPDTIYVATATGGVWKSTNRGSTWKELFKDRGTASLGAIAVAPSNPNIVWLGSGEAQSWRSTSWGNGVYKSEDAGKTWELMGLEETQHTGKIVIHPEDPDIVYVAGMGALWGSNEERGLEVTESIEAAVKEIDDEVEEILQEMVGEEEAGGAQQRGAPPLNEQIQRLYVRVEATTALPTADQRRLTRRSHERLGQQIGRIEGLVIRKLPALERQLDAAGIRWTPGRHISLPSTSSLPSGR